MRQNLLFPKIIFITFILSMFFVFTVSKSFAVITAPTELKTPAMLFEFPRKENNLSADKQVEQVDVSSAPSTEENKSWSSPSTTFAKAEEIVGCVLNNFYFDFTSLFKKTELMFSDTYNFLASGLTNLGISFFQEIQKINDSAFTTSWEQMKKINGNTFTTSLEQVKKIKSGIIDFTTSL